MDLAETQRLSELIQKKTQLVESLLDYVRQQSQMSCIDSPVQYNNLIKSRAIVIEEIKKQDVILQRNLRTVKTEDAGVQAELNEANARVDDLMKQIADLDQKCKTALTGEMQLVKNKLQALQTGKKGVKAYGGKVIAEPMGVFTDSKR